MASGLQPTIHLHQQLVECVLLLTLTIHVTSSLLPYSINLVDEEDTGSILSRHIKHVSYLQRRKPSVHLSAIT